MCLPASFFFFFLPFLINLFEYWYSLWFFNSVLCSLLKQLVSKILISSMTSLKNFNIVCMYMSVCMYMCMEVRRQPLVFILPCIFCCCVYHPGSQVFWGFFCLCLSPSSQECQDYRWVLLHTAFIWVCAFEVRSSWTHGKNPLPRTFFNHISLTKNN